MTQPTPAQRELDQALDRVDARAAAVVVGNSADLAITVARFMVLFGDSLQ